ncbi:MAG TPA: Gfo/Idh/MocA family oxidoreductase [Burkholderiales bacterium]|jgi:predicted dehydrogenase|nr:Gfo/Idh/MocA family oxidoreductase [Burkholderiales bacterium]
MSTLNIGVIGLGWWGRVIVPLAKSSAKLRVVAVADPDPAAAEFARQQAVPLAKSYDDVLADREVQGVVLCTPHTLHTDQIVRAANAGKHVFCEKPLSLSRQDVLKAVKSCNDNRVALGVGHEKRFEPPIQELMRMVKAGELGTPLQIEANFVQDKFLTLPPDNWRLSAKEAPAGPMTATGIHLLDLSVGVMGPAERVLASVRTLGSELRNGDTLGILVNFRSGANALLSAILATPFDGRFAVYGSKGWAEVRDKAHPESPRGWTLTTHLRGGEKETRDYPPAKAVLANLEAFADAAVGGAPYPVPQAEMIANVSALEAIFRSAARGEVQRVDNG